MNNEDRHAQLRFNETLRDLMDMKNPGLQTDGTLTIDFDYFNVRNQLRISH
jgi:hypothetical protein